MKDMTMIFGSSLNDLISHALKFYSVQLHTLPIEFQ